EVELIERRAERPQVAGGVSDGPRFARIPVEEPARKARARAYAPKPVRIRAERACAEIALGLQHRLLLVVAEEEGGVALAVGEVAADDHAVILDLAIGRDVTRHHELRGIRRGATRDDILHQAVLLVVVGAVADGGLE